VSSLAVLGSFLGKMFSFPKILPLRIFDAKNFGQNFFQTQKNQVLKFFERKKSPVNFLCAKKVRENGTPESEWFVPDAQGMPSAVLYDVRILRTNFWCSSSACSSSGEVFFAIA
jgi:hypothetical protein